jgi:hypothetical protein
MAALYAGETGSQEKKKEEENVFSLSFCASRTTQHHDRL